MSACNDQIILSLALYWRSSHFRLIVHRPILGSTLKMIIGEGRARIGDDDHDDYEHDNRLDDHDDAS